MKLFFAGVTHAGQSHVREQIRVTLKRANAPHSAPHPTCNYHPLQCTKTALNELQDFDHLRRTAM
jgi:hypothetical protein